MRDTESRDFRTLIEGVYSFYGKDCSRFALDVWWQAMKPYDLAAVNDALGRHCVNPDNGQFMPKPADVVKMIEGSTVDAAIVAWSKVDRGIRHVGTYASVVFDDPLIHRVIADMGGWPELGRKDKEEWPFVAKEFQTRYRGFKVTRTLPAYPAKLIGIFDQQNAAQGFQDQQQPMLIGDATAARSVLVGGSKQPLLQIGRMTDAA